MRFPIHSKLGTLVRRARGHGRFFPVTVRYGGPGSHPIRARRCVIAHRSTSRPGRGTEAEVEVEVEVKKAAQRPRRNTRRMYMTMWDASFADVSTFLNFLNFLNFSTRPPSRWVVSGRTGRQGGHGTPLRVPVVLPAGAGLYVLEDSRLRLRSPLLSRSAPSVHISQSYCIARTFWG